MFIKGFRFAMLLQLAIGPVCIFIFKTANEYGLWAAEAGVIAVMLADALFVALAIVGVGAVLEKPRVKSTVKVIGALVLIYFGLGTALGAFGVRIIPSIQGADRLAGASNAFLMGLLLTLSNPLTILCWTGVFATKVAEENFTFGDAASFGIGAVLATPVFLSLISVLAGILHLWMTKTVMEGLNIIVGAAIIGFGVRVVTKKEPPAMTISS